MPTRKYISGAPHYLHKLSLAAGRLEQAAYEASVYGLGAKAPNSEESNEVRIDRALHDIVESWEKLYPPKTPVGFDGVSKRIGDILLRLS